MGRHDEEHLRRFVAARERGDQAAMARCWEAVVIDFDARMDALVAGRHRGRLDPDEHREAVQLALVRFATGLIWTFKGRTVGELVNATKTLAHHICVDVQRAGVAARRREAVPLDAQGPSEAAAAAAAFEREAERRDAAEALSCALSGLPERERRVLELSLSGAPIEEIVAQLGVSRDNAYQIRSRAMRKLRHALEGCLA